ncbi:MAG TPA: hypothetical protein DCR93_37310 [Cytophagales bacterium]|nr:hypothetical protein [Cytophagales bacterium]HAP64911.1 hypothetical protein [Cytophagales bacterium]
MGQSLSPGAGLALEPDGNGYLELEEPLTDLSLSLMLEAWVYLPEGLSEPFPVFVSQDNPEGIAAGIWLWIFPEQDYVVMGYGDGQGPLNRDSLHSYSQVISIPLPRNRWFNVAANFSQELIVTYLDGLQQGNFDAGQPVSLGTVGNGQTVIGKGHLDGKEYYAHGLVDEVKIWQGWRFQTLLFPNLCRKFRGNEDSLRDYWTFDVLGLDSTFSNRTGGSSFKMMGQVPRSKSGAPLGDDFLFEGAATFDEKSIRWEINGISVLAAFDDNYNQILYRVNGVFPDEEGLTCAQDFYWGAFIPYNQFDVIESWTLTLSQGQELYQRQDGSQAWSGSPTLFAQNLPVALHGAHQFRPWEPQPDLLIHDTLVACESVSLSLTNADVAVTWNTGATAPNLSALQTGWYVVTPENGCLAQDSTYALILPPTEINLTSTINTTCIFPLFELNSSAIGDSLQYLWSTEEETAAIRVSTSGTYQVKVIGTCGDQTDEITVTIPDRYLDPIPTAFTPNGDGVNDLFTLPDYMAGIELKVLNRWGEALYSNNSYQNTWGGGALPEGIYYFLLEDDCSGEKRTSPLTIIR